MLTGSSWRRFKPCGLTKSRHAEKPRLPVVCRSSIFHAALCTGTESVGGKSALGRNREFLNHVPAQEIVSMERFWDAQRWSPCLFWEAGL